ncbi:uncharacterized protein [Mytilus edulis]|uniref:uncharacterized protein n=1 Tax=Mytilus edulis TaxID=6550 RepID=UPI0039EE3159
MCQNIVGTEDYVQRIRTFNAVRDNILSNTGSEYITSGSFGEGLEMRGSDLDIMHVDKHIEVLENLTPHIDPKITYFLVEGDDVKAGYSQLRLEYNRYQLISKCCVEQNSKYYMSSSLFKQRFLLGQFTIHGPCISDKDGKFDSAICFHCPIWISSAAQWLSRSTNSWPGNNVKQSIIKHGVIFVPIGVKGSPKEDLEWRISFSVGERLLINTFTHTQLLCYALLKIILKDIISMYSKCKDILCSYFLKTIVFWISEEMPQSVWKPDNMIPCFVRCLNRLIYSVENSVCLHYFIPENNLFDKIVGLDREILLEKLYTLQSYGWRCILFSDQMSNFDISKRIFRIEPHTIYVKEVEKTLKSKMLYRFPVNKSDEFNKTLSKIVFNSCDNFSIYHVYKYSLSHTCHLHAQEISVDSTYNGNKYQYEQYRSCLSTLLQNVYHDAASGWLMVASFFYKTKQYQQALLITKYTLAKCTPEKLFLGMNMSYIHYQLLKLKSLKEKCVVDLLRILLVRAVMFKKNSGLIPDELKMDIAITSRTYESTAYAYFLTFLCHFHLKDIRECQDSILSLQLVIEENYLKTNQYNTLEANTLLDIAFQLVGDKISATQAF